MSEIVKTSEDGRYRVRLESDPDPEAHNPRTESDHLSHVITPTQSRYIDVDKDGGPLQEGWNHFSVRPDSEKLFLRWVAAFHGAEVIEHRPERGAWGFWYLMPEQFSEVSDPKAYLEAEIQEYRAWADGEVYGWIIERRQGWTADDGSGATQETWEREDSRWGLIGSGYALEEAEREFADFLKDH